MNDDYGMVPDFVVEAGLPADLDAERLILGAIMLDNEAYFECEGITAEDFYVGTHQTLFRCINDIMFGLVEGIHAVDIVTLSDAISRRMAISSVGGVAYLASLTEGIPRKISIEEYVYIVHEKAKLRRLMSVGQELTRGAGERAASSTELMERAQERLLALIADEKIEATRIGEICSTVEEQIIAKRNTGFEKTAFDLTWGLEVLDVFTKGAFGGELTVVGADSSGGKTAFMLQMLLKNAMLDIPCAVFSLEMAKENLVRRLYPLLSTIITADKMRDPRKINLHTDVPELKRISSVIAKLPIWIDDTSQLTARKMCARAKIMRRKHKIRIFGTDYLQLMENVGKSGPEEVRSNVFAIRDFVKAEPDAHWVLLSQYSKDQGFMKKRRRTKGDLMGSSTIHHAAQNVLLITIESQEKRDKGDLLDAEIVIEKQREGGQGKVNCCFDRDSLSFVPSTSQGERRNDDSRSSPDTSNNRSAGRSGSAKAESPKALRGYQDRLDHDIDE